jgi:hypothetical protein
MGGVRGLRSRGDDETDFLRFCFGSRLARFRCTGDVLYDKEIHSSQNRRVFLHWLFLELDGTTTTMTKN